jgi:hypothetical protein
MRRRTNGLLRSGSLSFSLVLLLASGLAEAGQRHTVWAYPPGAGPRGAVEAETWITASRANSDSGTAAEYRLEIENGLTDDLSLDVYLGVLNQAPGQSVTFESVQASLRGNLARDAFHLPVDLTGYFEVKRDLDFSRPWGFEAILIGGKAFGRLSYSFNLVYESQLSSQAFRSDVREIKGIVTAGYEVTPRIWLGGELVAANDAGTKELSLGPTVSFGLTEKTWIAIGPQFGLNHATDDLAVRAIFGIFF